MPSFEEKYPKYRSPLDVEIPKGLKGFKDDTTEQDIEHQSSIIPDSAFEIFENGDKLHKEIVYTVSEMKKDLKKAEDSLVLFNEYLKDKNEKLEEYNLKNQKYQELLKEPVSEERDDQLSILIRDIKSLKIILNEIHAYIDKSRDNSSYMMEKAYNLEEDIKKWELSTNPQHEEYSDKFNLN